MRRLLALGVTALALAVACGSFALAQTASPPEAVGALDACLVPTDELTPEKWERLNDPFPAFGEAQTALEPAA
ncbi:MAG: hypothetical protein O9266_00655 [Porphyrobacter sp.]|jgi:hypothetical protein|nr:hypothetical protein [Porphyrobacter sp.]